MSPQSPNRNERPVADEPDDLTRASAILHVGDRIEFDMDGNGTLCLDVSSDGQRWYRIFLTTDGGTVAGVQFPFIRDQAPGAATVQPGDEALPLYNAATLPDYGIDDDHSHARPFAHTHEYLSPHTGEIRLSGHLHTPDDDAHR